ncbi:MAG: CDP-glycerol glycerophosphotransferase family protein, partial [Lactobacillus iners]|nr:CDP-glycerol glycerophosphotransferase family protein [Lactobacillus iners]
HLAFKTWLKIGRAKHIFTTHQPFKIKSKQVLSCFWHGIPLKKMALMSNNTSYKSDCRNIKSWQKADYISSSSSLYETLMTSCISVKASKYVRTGFPRIDALYNPDVTKADVLKQYFNVTDVTAKIGVYMPTFRYELEDDSIMDKISRGNFFAFDYFDLSKLEQVLQKKNKYLIVKLHPYEMKKIDEKCKKYDHIYFLKDIDLFKFNYDMYDLLGNTDFLITDFSSVYFDYLHLDKPIYFVTNFLKEYEKTRGLLMGPYADIVPGAKINTFVELLDILENDTDTFAAARHQWLNMTYEIDFQQNCKRCFDALK